MPSWGGAQLKNSQVQVYRLPQRIPGGTEKNSETSQPGQSS